MAAMWRRGLLLGLVLLILTGGVGCNLLEVPFFIFGPEPKESPKLKQLASEDKDQQVTVLILAYEGMETRPEFLRADRELSFLVAKQLRECFKYNKENVKVVSPAKVEEFKNEHPNWHTLEPAELANRFHADYVIDLEINQLSMYQPGSSNLLYRGHADLTLTLVDVNNPDEGEEKKELTVTDPEETRGGAIPIDDLNPQAFKAEFFNKIATQVAWHFTSHPTSDSYRCE